MTDRKEQLEMSVVRQFSMRCDECGDGEDDFCGSYSEDIRREAKEAGWIRRGNRDICVDCAGGEDNW
jgi:hypothetical protein